MPQLTNDLILAAIDGFEAKRQRVDAQIADLRGLLKGHAPAPHAPAATPAGTAAPGRKRRKFSAATRRKMKAAQQARWAKIRGEAGSVAPAKTASPTVGCRKVSATTRRKMRAAHQARWAKIRGGAGAAPARAASPTPKHKMSAAGRRAIVAAQKKRWALKRAAAAKVAPGKKAAA